MLGGTASALIIMSAFKTVSKGQVALEDQFRFVLKKSDLKSPSDKTFVRKATVVLENKSVNLRNGRDCGNESEKS